MTAKIALFLTGGYRIFDKTWKLIKKNIVLPNNATVFCYCESTLDNNEFCRKMYDYFKDNIGYVKTVTSSRTDEFNNILLFLLNTKPGLKKEIFDAVGLNRQYIITSGSILEYYQYMQCYNLMLQYEKDHNIYFNTIIRSRPDIPIYQELHIKKFFEQIDTSFLNNGIEHYIRSLLNNTIYTNNINNKNILQYKYKYNPFKGIYITKKTNIQELINNEQFIWTIYDNWIWIGKRHVMEKLYAMIYFYGDYIGDNYSFNSETQFREYLIRMNCRLIQYCTEAESELWSNNELEKMEIVDNNGELIQGIDLKGAIASLLRR